MAFYSLISVCIFLLEIRLSYIQVNLKITCISNLFLVGSDFVSCPMVSFRGYPGLASGAGSYFYSQLDMLDVLPTGGCVEVVTRFWEP